MTTIKPNEKSNGKRGTGEIDICRIRAAFSAVKLGFIRGLA